MNTSISLLGILDFDSHDCRKFFQWMGTSCQHPNFVASRCSQIPNIFPPTCASAILKALEELPLLTIMDFPPEGELLDCWNHFCTHYLESHRVGACGTFRYAVKQDVIIPPSFVILLKGKVFKAPKIFNRRAVKVESYFARCVYKSNFKSVSNQRRNLVTPGPGDIQRC